MQTPICTFCAKTDTLCGHCERKLQEGKISQFDVGLSKHLYENYGDLDIEYISSFMANNVAVLFFKGNIAPLVGKGGREVQKLNAKFGKRVKIINLNADIKDIISDITYPVTLLGINKLFTSEGEVEKIRLAKRDMLRIPFDIGSMEKIMFNLLQKRIRISFE